MAVTKYESVADLIEALEQGRVPRGAVAYASRAVLDRIGPAQHVRLRAALRARGVDLQPSVTREAWLVVDDRGA